MSVLLSESSPVARKDHECIACIFIKEMLSGYGWTFAEYREIAKAKKSGWMIKKGQEYVRQNIIQDGEIFTYKAIPEIHEICIKWGVFDDC